MEISTVEVMEALISRSLNLVIVIINLILILLLLFSEISALFCMHLYDGLL